MWGSANSNFFFSGSSNPNAKKNNNSEKIEQINACISNLEKAQNDIDVNVKQCIDKINTDFNELISTINDRKTAVLQKLYNISETKKNSMDIEINKLKQYLEEKDNNNSNNNNIQYPSERQLKQINTSIQKHQNEIFYTNQHSKQQFITLMNNYGDISLPLNKPLLLSVRNNSRNYNINFKWHIKANNNEDYNINKIKIEWQNMEDKKENENINISEINVINNDKNIYENTVNVGDNGNYSIKIQYFESNLQIWSKLSDIKFVTINKINEQFITFDIYDKNYISIDDNIISGNGIKKGKHARMISCSKGYNNGLCEWKIKCVNYDSSSTSGNASHAIGIFTNNNIASNGANWVNDNRIDYAYYWNSYRRYIYGSINGEYIFENNVNDGWKSKDIITILLDCRNWTIQFSKNGNVVNSKPYKIKPNKSYYPLIVMRSPNDQYQSLTYD